MVAPNDGQLLAALRTRWSGFAASNGLARAFKAIDPLEGQLLRPRVLWLSARCAGLDPAEMTDSALAIQLIHTASILHDDLLDDAASRRGAKTLPAKQRLLLGDLLITSAYRLAAPLPAARAFADAVHRMAVGEAAQGAAGSQITYEAYAAALHDKSGALFGWAMAAPWHVYGDAAAAAQAATLGDRLGYIYQLIDDVLDWCPYTDTGKPPLQDAKQGKKTLPVFEYRGQLGGSTAEQVGKLFADGAMARAARRIEHEGFHWLHDARTLIAPQFEAFQQIVRSLTNRALTACSENEARILTKEKLYA